MDPSFDSTDTSLPARQTATQPARQPATQPARQTATQTAPSMSAPPNGNNKRKEAFATGSSEAGPSKKMKTNSNPTPAQLYSAAAGVSNQSLAVPGKKKKKNNNK